MTAQTFRGWKAVDVTTDLLRRLRNRERDGEIFLCQVGDDAGFRNRGWSDAISMQTWPSKTLVIRGYEVKATRSDWLRELDLPAKNVVWQKQCHEWYVVAPKDVVRGEELPSEWGLLVPKGNDALRIAKRPSAKIEYLVDVPVSLMAAVFRAVGNERDHFEKVGRREIYEEERERVAGQIERLEREAKDWESRHMELVEALGGRRWDNFDKLKKIAAAVSELEKSEDPKRLVRELCEKLELTATRMREVEGGM